MPRPLDDERGCDAEYGCALLPPPYVYEADEAERDELGARPGTLPPPMLGV